MRFKGKVAIVTGGRQEATEQLISSLGGQRLMGITTNVAHCDQIEQMINGAVER